jgi:hypothetical protein
MAISGECETQPNIVGAAVSWDMGFPRVLVRAL